MKRKLLVILLALMASVCLVLGLSACDLEGDDGHTHSITYVAAEAATCTQDGHAEYWYCADCGKYFTDAKGNNETTIAQLAILATGHEWGEWQTTNPATCTEDGLQKRVCEKCSEEESDTIIAVGHSPADPVRENEVPATCTAEGSYDEVVYCEVCDTEISRTSKTIEKTAHTSADPVRENEVPATCTAEGSYDEVVYCEVCHEEVSRTSKTIDKLAHTYSDEWSFDDTYHWHAATCCDTGAVSDKAEHTVENGACTVCGTILVGTEGLEFSLSSDKAYYIVSGKGSAEGTDIVIPSVYNGLPVTSIGNYAFYNCCSLTSITIPDSVTSIGILAFSGCNKLIEVYNLSSLNIKVESYDNGCIAYYAKDVYTSLDTPSKLTTTEDGFVIYTDEENKEYLLIGYAGNETEITFPADINGNNYAIYEYAFHDCDFLESITISDSVTSIDNYAFYGCTSLESITIPDSVTSIGNWAFFGCSNITTATMPAIAIDYIPQDNLQTVVITSGESIGNSAFEDYTSLESVTIPNGVTSIGYSAFAGCTSLTSIVIPDSVTSIREETFNGCTNLIQVENGVSYVDKWVIDCDSLVTNVVLRENTVGIADSAFEDCSLLTSVTVPDSVTKIGWNAFNGCWNITMVTMPATAIDYIMTQNNPQTVVITSGSIRDYAFYNCSPLTSVTIGNGVTSIGGSAFYGCYKLIEVYNMSSLNITAGSNDNGYIAYYAKDVYTSLDTPSKLADTEDGFVVYADEKKEEYLLVGYAGNETEITLPSDINGNNYAIYKYAFYNCDSLTSVTIPDGVTSIGNYAFYNCYALTSVTIGNSVTSIGSSAFMDCDSLTSVTIGNSVTSIGYRVFYGCTSLESVYIPDSVTSIGLDAFVHCTSLTSVTIGNSVTSIGNSAFNNCTSLTSITIPDSVTSIGYGAFWGCTSLESITIPDSVTSIGENAFYGCTNLIQTENGVRYVDEWVVDCDSSVANAVLREGTVGIADSAFNDCSSLTSITILDDVTFIGNSAFEDCSSLTSITIPDGVTSIGMYAFQSCSSLESIIIPDSVTEIGGNAFDGCTNISMAIMPATAINYIPQDNLQVVVITSGESMRNSAFKDCTLLESITIPDSVTSIGDYAFSNCRSLEVVYYGGTESDWAEISIGSNNDDLTAATRYYYSETQPTEDGNFWHYAEDGVTPVIWIKEKTEP